MPPCLHYQICGFLYLNCFIYLLIFYSAEDRIKDIESCLQRLCCWVHLQFCFHFLFWNSSFYVAHAGITLTPYRKQILHLGSCTVGSWGAGFQVCATGFSIFICALYSCCFGSHELWWPISLTEVLTAVVSLYFSISHGSNCCNHSCQWLSQESLRISWQSFLF